MTCASCRFWDRYDMDARTKDKGDCRRRAPVVNETILSAFALGDIDDIGDRLVAGVYVASAFPVTHETSWCGEYDNAVPLC